MEVGCSPTVLVLSCKSPLEDELARSLKSRHEALKLNGQEVRISLHSEEEHLTFNPSSYMDALTASRFGRLLIWSPRIPSTHDLVSKNFDELPVGTACLADVQYKGRGRAKNVWESPAGCLLFSFTVQMQDGRKLPLLQYVVSLAVTEAIKEVCRAKGLPHLNARIKWPNDLYLNGLKVGGILCTSTYRSEIFNVCAGIGLNLDNELPTTCLNAVLRKINSASHRLSREDILASFFNKFEDLFDSFSNQGFQPLEELYYNTWLHSGQKVVIEEKQDGKLEENITVTIKGLTSTGYLLATDDERKSYELHPDGNRYLVLGFAAPRDRVHDIKVRKLGPETGAQEETFMSASASVREHACDRRRGSSARDRLLRMGSLCSMLSAEASLTSSKDWFGGNWNEE